MKILNKLKEKNCQKLACVGRGGLSRGKIKNGHLDPPRVVYWVKIGQTV